MAVQQHSLNGRFWYPRLRLSMRLAKGSWPRKQYAVSVSRFRKITQKPPPHRLLQIEIETPWSFDLPKRVKCDAERPSEIKGKAHWAATTCE